MRFLRFIGDAFLEIVISLLMFLLGYGVLKLAGISVDADIALLVGALTFLISFIIVVIFINLTKR